MFRDVHLLLNAAAGSAGAFDVPDGWARWDLGADLSPEAAAARAREAGADLVVAAGGDGTVNGVACALAHTGVPVLIVPFGTANVLATDLGVPTTPEGAVALATGRAEGRLRDVDVGRLLHEGESPDVFVLRLGLGVEASMVTHADPALKARVGRLAYFAEFVRETRAQRPVTYRLVLDGERRRDRGMTCLVCNSVNPGLRGVDAVAGAGVADGRLTVLVFRRASVGALARLVAEGAWSAVRGRGFHVDRSRLVGRYAAREVEVVADPVQEAACDGEPLAAGGRLRARVDPGALRVLVPA